MKRLFGGLVAFITAFVGMVGYRCLLGVPAGFGKYLAVVMIALGVVQAAQVLWSLWLWGARVRDSAAVPYADIWHVQHGRPSAQYLCYYGSTWRGWHELEQRMFFFLSVRCMILGF